MVETKISFTEYWRRFKGTPFTLDYPFKAVIAECNEKYPCQGLGEHAHFRSFGMAFLTLFRIATG